MSNTNGLIASSDVCATGDPDSAYFIRKGEPIAVPSPLQIISPNGTKVGSLSEDNSGVLGLSTEAQIQLMPGVDADVVIQTDPSVAGNECGLTISRTLPTAQSCSLHLDQTGTLDVSPQQGGMNLFAQGGARNLNLYCDPTGFCSISNANDGADGEIIINTASATDSKVLLNVRPPASSASGLAITNITNASSQVAYVNAGGDGSLELSATTNIVRVRADGSDGEGLIVAPFNETTGNSALNIRNGTGSATPTNFVFYNSTATGGGLTAGDLELFSYTPGNIKRCLDVVPGGGAVTIGDDGTVGGCVVKVAGSLGQSRVYDPIYNPVPAFATVGSWTTDMTSGQNLATFTLPADGLYMLYTTIDVSSATLAPVAVGNYFGSFLIYGDPAHGALIVPNTTKNIASYSLSKDASTGFGNFSITSIMSLSTTTYEPNQRYKWAKSQVGGYTGGTVVMTLYRLA